MAWYPNAGSYQKYLQNLDYIDSVKDEIDNLRGSIVSNTTKQTRELIANQNQISKVYVNRLDNITSALNSGFSSVESAIAAFHASFNEKMEMVIGRLDLINDNLKKIVYALHNPEEMQVTEHYRRGCRHVYEGNLDIAEKEFIKALDKDEADFPTHLALGKLYLNGYDKLTGINVCNIGKANYHLIQASTRFGRGKLRSNPASSDIVSVAFLYASRSYYVQMQSINDIPLLEKAIDLASESTRINPHFSQAHFYLARYYAVANRIQEMKDSLIKAIEIDRSYFIEIDIDKTFESVKNEVAQLQKQLWNQEKNKVKPLIDKAIREINELNRYSFEGSQYKEKFTTISDNFDLAQNNFDLNNYFGFLDAKKYLNSLNIR